MSGLEGPSGVGLRLHTWPLVESAALRESYALGLEETDELLLAADYKPLALPGSLK
jgi:hypothetical protein